MVVIFLPVKRTPPPPPESASFLKAFQYIFFGPVETKSPRMDRPPRWRINDLGMKPVPVALTLAPPRVCASPPNGPPRAPIAAPGSGDPASAHSPLPITGRPTVDWFAALTIGVAALPEGWFKNRINTLRGKSETAEGNLNR